MLFKHKHWINVLIRQVQKNFKREKNNQSKIRQDKRDKAIMQIIRSLIIQSIYTSCFLLSFLLREITIL